MNQAKAPRILGPNMTCNCQKYKSHSALCSHQFLQDNGQFILEQFPPWFHRLTKVISAPRLLASSACSENGTERDSVAVDFTETSHDDMAGKYMEQPLDDSQPSEKNGSDVDSSYQYIRRQKLMFNQVLSELKPLAEIIAQQSIKDQQTSIGSVVGYIEILRNGEFNPEHTLQE